MASWEEFSRIVAEAKAAKKLDPVGKEDDDINNDNKVDSTDDYLKNKRSAVGAAIAADKKKKNEKDSDEMCEAKVDEKLPEHERATARDKRSGHNLPGSGTRRVRRAEHEERRGKPKRWWDNDGDGIGWEKGEVKKEEVERIDEIAPLIAGGLALGGALAAGSAIKRAQDAAKSGVDAANRGQKVKNPGTGIAGAAYGMQRRNNALRDAMKQLNQSYQPEGEQLDEMPYQVYGSPDGKKINKIGKSVKSRRYAQNRADELSDTHKETGGKYHVQKEESELQEKALSRAQQRFFGMVRAEQEGKMKKASPEVRAAAKSMTTQQAHDFAATKHAGLPEKKEVKEELSLVDKILAEASEAQLMAAKARKEELAKKQKARLKQAKLSVAANKALKDAQSSGGEETGKDQENKPKLSAAERAAERVASGRIEVAKIQQQTEREKEAARTHRQTRSFERTDASKKEKDEKKAASDAAKDAEKKQKAKKKELEAKEQERKDAEKAKKKQKEEHKSELKQDIKKAWSGGVEVSASEKDTDVASAMMSNAAKVGGGVLKTGGALLKYGIKRVRAKGQEKQKNQKEEFSNWREEFIFEVDDQSVKNEKQKVIDVSKVKNKIEINPNMSEGCGCDEKEKTEKPEKDMRGLATKINLAKTKARSAGVRNPIVMVASEEVEIEEGMTMKDFKQQRSRQKQKEKRASEKTSPLRRAGIHADKASPERAARHRANVDPDFEGNDERNYPGGKLRPNKVRKAKALGELEEGAAWTKKEGKSEAGGLNEKGRKSYERENPGSDLKAPSKKVGNPRRASFCARMSGMKAKLTSKKTANDPDSRINKSLRAWNC